MESFKWVGEVLKTIVLITVVSIGLFFSRSPSAQFIDLGGETCVQNWAWFDYYTKDHLNNVP